MLRNARLGLLVARHVICRHHICRVVCTSFTNQQSVLTQEENQTIRIRVFHWILLQGGQPRLQLIAKDSMCRWTWSNGWVRM